MRCMCPNCGEILESGDLSFYFTDYIRDMLLSIMNKMDDIDEDQISAAESLLNRHKKQNPFLFSEKYLWSLPAVNPKDDNVNMKEVYFTVPCDMLLKLESEIQSLSDPVAAKEFLDWLQENKKKIEANRKVLSLVKEGEGDIRFNRITGVADNRICPKCRAEMSFWAGRYVEWTMTVLGGPRVSKSTALTACISGFMDGTDPIIRVEGSEYDTAFDTFKKNCLDSYEKGRAIKATNTSQDNDGIPQVSFKVSVGKKNICLTFIDLPGELNGQDGISEALDEKYHRIFNNIDFVWYCTNPAEILQLESKAIPEDLGYDNADVVTNARIIANMTRLSSYFAHAKRKVPVAYILGKTDSSTVDKADKKTYGLFRDEDSSEKKDIEYDVPFDVRAFFRRSDKVRKYIKSKNESLLVNFENNFHERCYIATSAYGYNPKTVKEDETRTPNGFRTKEVLYWMLALRNCIEIKTEITEQTFFGLSSRTREVIGYLKDLDDSEMEKTYHNLYLQGHWLN